MSITPHLKGLPGDQKGIYRSPIGLLTPPTEATRFDDPLDNLPSLGEALLPPLSDSNWVEAPQSEPSPSIGLGSDEQEEQWKGTWRPEMPRREKVERRDWLAAKRGRRGLRIMIVTENFLPKVDGVTMTLAKLLDHLKKEGHECMVLGPETGMVS